MRTLLVSVVLVGFFILPSAQHANAQFPEEVGVKGGVTSAGISQDVVYDSRRKGRQFLLYAEWLNASFFSVVTEAGYTQRGFEGEAVRGVEGVYHRGMPTFVIQQMGKASARLDYLTTSLLGKVSVSFLGTEPYVLAGVRLNKLLNRDMEVTTYNAFSTEQVEANSIASEYESVAYGVTGGVGVTLPDVFPVRLSLEARYDRDLSDSVSGFGFSESEVRNNAFTVMLGIGF